MMDYNLLLKQLSSLTKGVSNNISNYANAAALLYNSLSNINWAGFYLLNGDMLELGPFQGKAACTKIPVGKGVCGTAVSLNQTLVVDDVHNFRGHIACDSASNSEIVIPIRKEGTTLGVLDIDSPIRARFNDLDKEGLERFVAELQKSL